MDLSNFSISELRNLQLDVANRIERGEKAERAKAIESIYAIAHSLGMPLNTLIGSSGKKTRSAPSVTYVNPENSSNRWMGRGPRPAWVKNALAAGKSLDQLRA